MKLFTHQFGQSGPGRASRAGVIILALSTWSLSAFAEESVGGLPESGRTVPGIGLEMARIPAGRFIMGSPKKEEFRRDDETPHRVTISKPFWMGVHEVTQQQFYQLTIPDFDLEGWLYFRGPITEGGAFHYRKQPPGVMHVKGEERQPDFPMECVSWLRAVDYCKTLTEIESKAGRLPKGYVYRLPSEAEWEYACRAGSPGMFNVEVDTERLKKEALEFPEDTSKQKTLNTFAFANPINPRWSKTDKVGNGRKANAWGLYDMHGNVAEWVLDTYGPYSAVKDSTDPVSFRDGEEKVIRGGSIAGGYPFMRSATRYSVRPDANYYGFVGFRVVLAPAVKIPLPVTDPETSR